MGDESLSPLIPAVAGCRDATDNLLRRLDECMRVADVHLATSRAHIETTRELLRRLEPLPASSAAAVAVERVWRLQGQTPQMVTGTVGCTPAGTYRLSVCRGEMELIAEEFADARAAAARAAQIAHDLRRLGWSDVAADAEALAG